MPIARHQQATLNSGEFDGLLDAREDVSFYYSAADQIENCVVIPQSGAKRRPALRKVARQRAYVSQMDLSGVTATAPNGGTAANAVDGTPGTFLTTTTAIGTTDPYVILHLDFGAPLSDEVEFIDIQVARFTSLPAANASETVRWQSSTDNAAWTLRDSLQVGTGALNRRYAKAPGTTMGTDRYWRLVRTGSNDLLTATFEVDDVRFWTAGSPAVLGTYRFHRMSLEDDERFHLLITRKNVDIFDDTGAWVAACNTLLRTDEIEEVAFSGRLDTMIFYHRLQQPHFIQRVRGEKQWAWGTIEFDSISQVAFDDSTTGGRNEKQELRFSSMTAGDEYQVELADDISAPITWSATPATNATNIETAIEAMETFSSVTVTSLGNDRYEIEFDGDDGLTEWALLVLAVLYSASSGTIENRRTQAGRPHRDDLWSVDRGYPRAGAFYQGRHWMVGFDQRPEIAVASRVNALFDFKQDDDPVASSPIVYAPDLDERITFRAIYPGRHLQFFADGVELYQPDEPITPDNIALKPTTRMGISAKGQPTGIQGGTLFVDSTGTAIREYLFTDGESSYQAEPISKLGGHLVADPFSLKIRKALDVDEPTLLLIPNAGVDRDSNVVPSALVTIDRVDQITAFTRIVTQGTVLDFSTVDGAEALALVQRTLDGQTWNYIEIEDESCFSDYSLKIANADLDQFTATASQTVFTYTFTSPLTDDLVSVFTRALSTDPWVMVESDAYTVDLGAKTVTFDTGLAAGVLVSVNLRKDTISLPGGHSLNGETVQVHTDGISAGQYVPSAGSISLGDPKYDFEAEVGLRMVPLIRLLPYRGKGGPSPTMKKQRIFRALLQVTNTSALTVRTTGVARDVPVERYGDGVYDQNQREGLFTGALRVSGILGWATEPKLEISQDEPGPFYLNGVTYDVRF